MNKSQQHEELLGLLSELADAELDAPKAARIEELLANDPGARLLYMQHIDLQIELACMAEAGIPKEAPITKPGGENAKVVPIEAPARLARTTQRRRWWLAAAAAVAFGLGLFLWQGAASDRLVAQLDHIKGEVLIIPKKGLPWSPDAVVDIRSSYTIRVRGDGSSAVLVYPDGTLVALVGDTELSFGKAETKDLEMSHGVLAASVTKQPTGRPMTVATPTAEVEVVGTEFTLETDSANTHLAVLEGAVNFIRNTDSNRVQLAEGEVATVGSPPPSGEPEPELVAAPQMPPPADWRVDFESGLPVGWKRGELEINRLPPGSKGAAKAEKVYDGSRPYHQIEAPSSFVHGQYQINTDTHLHITYRMERPKWVNIFIGARDAELRGATWHMYKNVAINAESTPPRVWQTITIPLTEFQHTDGSAEPIVGKVPFGILISSTPDSRGLVVDAIWVTQGGPGTVQTQKVESR